MVIRLGMALIAMPLGGATMVSHATPMACQERLLPPSLGAATGQRPVTARDIVELRDFGRVDSVASGEAPFSVSPDGKYVAIALRRADADANQYCFGIAVVALGHGSGMSLVDVGGEFIPSVNDIRGIPAIPNGLPLTPAPLWSTDGSAIYYLRRDEGVTQVWRATLDGKAARPLTDLQTDALSLEWSGDSHKLILATRPSLAAATVSLEREAFRGYHFDARFWILFEARPRPVLPLPEQVSELDPDSGELRVLNPAELARLRSAPDSARPAGAELFARSISGDRAWTARDASGILSPARLNVEFAGKRRACPELVCGRRMIGIWWDKAGDLLILRGGGPEDGGLLSFYRWSRSEAQPRRLTSTSDALLSCTPWRTAFLCAHESSRRPRTIVRYDADTGHMETLYDPNPEFASATLGSVERIRFSGPNGIPTYADLVLPPDHRPGQRHPLIVTQYHSTGFLRGGTGDEYPIFLLARAGFAVLSFQKPGNPPEIERAVDINTMQRLKVRGWAERRAILSALEAGIDSAIAGGAVDPARIGLTGMSDGASTVQFALLNSTRFRVAAISSCCDEQSGLFTVGPAYREAVLAWGYPRQADDGRAFWKPISLAQNAPTFRIPLLIQIPDAEYRLSLETVSALQQYGAPVEMYVFPGEYHLKAQPAHRLAVYERSVAWFQFWLDLPLLRLNGLEQELERWRAMRDEMSRRAPPLANAATP